MAVMSMRYICRRAQGTLLGGGVCERTVLTYPKGAGRQTSVLATKPLFIEDERAVHHTSENASRWYHQQCLGCILTHVGSDKCTTVTSSNTVPCVCMYLQWDGVGGQETWV